ncbi:MAG: hypothetical protein AABX73_03040 [Nanoarchaeota archaeon]
MTGKQTLNLTFSNSWQSISNGENVVTTLPIATTTKFVMLEFNFTTDTNNFYTPILRDNIILNSFFAEENSCVYTSGNWSINCYDNCTIASNVVIDNGANVTITGDTGSLAIEQVNITGFYDFTINQCEVFSKNPVVLR